MTIEHGGTLTERHPTSVVTVGTAADLQKGSGFIRLLSRYPDLAPVGLLLLVVVIGNLPYLSGFANPNPMHWVSGLADPVRQGLLPGWYTADPNAGFTAQALGHRAALDLLHGRLPWWNPYEGLGAPLAGSMQGAALFPLTLLLAFPNGQVVFFLALEVVAGVSTYYLLRRLGVLRSVAVVGGAAFALNGTFAWFRYAAANPVAFLPLLLLGVEICCDPNERRRGRGVLAVALGVALSLYAGFPETAYIDGVFAAVWTGVRLVQHRRGDWRRVLGRTTSGVVSGVLLAAPILVAMLDYMPHWETGGGHDSFAFGGLPRAGLSMLTLPYIHGPIAGFSDWDKSGALMILWGNVGGYTAITLILLALLGLVGRAHRTLRWALAAWSVLVIWRTFTFGPSWVTSLFHLVPGFRQTAFYRYSQPTWEFAIVVLAALGLNDLLRKSIKRAWVIGAVGVAALTLLISAQGSQALANRLAGAPHQRVWWILSVAGAAVAVFTAGCAATFLRDRTRVVAVSSVVLIEVVALFVIPQFSAPRSNVETGGVRFLQAQGGTSRFFTLGPIAPGYGSYFGLGSVAINNFPPKKYWEFVKTTLNKNVNPIVFTGTTRVDPAGPSPAQEFVRNMPNYEAAGVKYVVLHSGDTLPAPADKALPEVYRDDVLRILELPNPKPYFEAIDGGCRLRFSDRTKVSASCDRPGTLIRRELFMPGWNAQVNGRKARLSEDQSVFQAVKLPQGTSTVTFGFTPPRLGPALIAFMLGVALAMDQARAHPPIKRHKRCRSASFGARAGGTGGGSDRAGTV